MRSRRRVTPTGPAGFTLVELLVTLAVVLILLSVAVSSWRWLVSGSRLSSTADLLWTGYRMARTEAVKTTSTMTFKPATGTDWNSGWIVTNAAGQIVWRSGTLPTGVVINAPSGVSQVKVLGSGISQQAGAFTVTTDSGHRSLCLFISGQSYLSDGSC